MPAENGGPPAREPAPVLWRALALLAALALLVDLNSLPGTVVGDDIPIIALNPRVATLDIRGIFTTDYWGPGERSGLYRPLTLLSFAVDRSLFGARPGPHHLVNVLLHAGVAVLFARALLALGFALPLAWTAAALFAVHPIHTDSVSILVGRSELLVGLFVFLALWASRSPGRRSWPIVLAAYAAALLAKEHAVTFLPLLVLCDCFGEIRWRQRLRQRLPLYLLLLAATLGWLLLRRWIAASSPIGSQMIYAVDNPLVNAELPARLLTAVRVNLDYLLSLIWPLRLQSVYSGPGLTVIPGLFSVGGAVALGYAALLAAAAVHGWRRGAAHGLGLAFYVISFAVTSNFFVPISVLRADRLAYLPSAGFSLAAAGVLLAAAERLRRTPAGGAAAALPALCILALSLGAIGRNALFREPERLWESAVRIDPGNARAWTSLAQVHWGQGRVAAAEQSFRSAIAAAPAFPDIYAAYAHFLLEQNRPDEAEAIAARGVALTPGAIGLGTLVLARARIELGRPEEALPLLEEGAPRFTQFAAYWKALGRAREGLEDHEAAIACYGRALQLEEDRDVSWRLASLLVRIGRPAEAERILRPLLASAPTAAEYNLLGVSLALQNRLEEARMAFVAAIRLDPSSAKYRENLERASAP